MHTPPDKLNLAPPPTGHWLLPMALALLVHGLLVAALTWGVGWKRDTPPMVFEAEIWSPTTQAAAPRAEPLVEPLAEPLPEPPPEPLPEPPVEPIATAPPAPPPAAPPEPTPAKPAPPPGPSAAELATQRAEQARVAAQKAQAEAEKKAADKAKADKAKADKAAAELAQKRAQEKAQQKARQEAQERQAREQAEQLAEAKRLEEQAQQAREAQMRRLMGQVGATGGAQASGSAPQNSGPSPDYVSRLKARIKPNVVFTDPISGNPRTEVEVRTLPDGTIASRRIVKSSGNPAWDDAALRAIDRTGTLPRDTDGRVHSPLIIVLSPLD